jgi:hypothetical protein
MACFFLMLCPPSTLAEPLSIVKNGMLLSASFAINLFNAAIQPVSF